MQITKRCAIYKTSLPLKATIYTISFLEKRIFAVICRKKEENGKGSGHLIAKERKKSDKIIKLEAALGRLPLDHFKRQLLEQELRNRLKGYRGEQSLDYHLSFLPNKEYIILHDLRLSNGTFFFQIDTLIITPQVIIILEIKNLSGTLFFDRDTKQLIQTNHEGKEKGYPDPLIQVMKQRMQLQQWINQNLSINPPIEHFVVISDPSSILKTNPGNHLIFKRICHSAVIVNFILDLKNKHMEVVLTSKSIKKLTNLLIKHNVPLHVDILQNFGIPKEDIITGALCSSCSLTVLQYKQCNWSCPKCGGKFKDAHINATHDYFLLINPTITNQKLREFLHISSRSVSLRILNSMNLSYYGDGKGRLYFLP